MVPGVDIAGWTLKVHGLVDREVTLTYEDLVALPILEQFVTIACVSNEVGDDLVGNAKWTGVALREVLAMAGVQPSADRLVGRSVDGFTAGMPVEWVMDPSREPLIAVAMNGEPLPRALRLPGPADRAGAVRLRLRDEVALELELTRFDTFQGFWIRAAGRRRLRSSRSRASTSRARTRASRPARCRSRGLRGRRTAASSPSRSGSTRARGRRRSVRRDLRGDLGAVAVPRGGRAGSHQIEVRATDGTGDVQTDQRTRPRPTAPAACTPSG